MKPALVLTLSVLGCGGASPATTPAPQEARASTLPAVAKALINASVQVAFRATVSALNDVSLELQLVDEERGTVETPYFDLARHEWRAEPYPMAERLVRLRATIQPDTLGRGSRVAVFVLYQRQRLGMAIGRATERAVPSDHPGAEFARKLIDRIERKAMGAPDR